MTKAEIIDRVSQMTGMNRKETMAALEVFLDAIKEALQRGEKVSLVGFGTFSVKQARPRLARNPRTGQRIQVSPRQVASFRAGKDLLRLINDGTQH